MEAQLKRINENHQEVWRDNHECVRAELKHTLVENHNSFEMHEMVIRADQLLHIAEATGSKIHTRELEAETDSQARTLVLS